MPEDAPEPKNKNVVTVSIHYANLYHNVVTGKSVVRTLHFLNKTPMDWCIKRKVTVEIAT